MIKLLVLSQARGFLKKNDEIGVFEDKRATVMFVVDDSARFKVLAISVEMAKSYFSALCHNRTL